MEPCGFIFQKQSDLMSDKLKKLRRRKVDYDYLNELFAEYQIDKTTNKFKELIIPFCNFIAGDLYVKISASYHIDYQEYFSAATAAVYNCLNRRNASDFNSPNAFYVYMKRSSWFDARNLILSERKDSANLTPLSSDDTEEDTESPPSDVRDTLNFHLQERHITKVYMRLTELYPWSEKVALRRFYYDFLAGKDRKTAKYSPEYSELSEQLNVTIIRVKELEKISKIIFKISLMHNMNDDFSIKKFPKIRTKEKEYFDKFFLVLACMDRYPYLMELLSVLGTDKFFEILKIFGGVSVNIPRVSDLRKVDTEVTTYVDFLGKMKPEEIKDQIKNGKRTTLGFVNSSASKIQLKLDTIFTDAYTE